MQRIYAPTLTALALGLTAQGATALVPNSRLRREAPLLLVDFYEAKMSFPA